MSSERSKRAAGKRKKKSKIFETKLNLGNPNMTEVICSQQRKSWTREKKLEVVNYAQQYSVYRASNKYGVDRKSIREWKIKVEEIYKQQKGTRAKRGRAEEHPILEEKLYRKFQKRKPKGRKTTERWLIKTAQEMHRNSGSSLKRSVRGLHGLVRWIWEPKEHKTPDSDSKREQAYKRQRTLDSCISSTSSSGDGKARPIPPVQNREFRSNADAFRLLGRKNLRRQRR